MSRSNERTTIPNLLEVVGAQPNDAPITIAAKGIRKGADIVRCSKNSEDRTQGGLVVIASLDRFALLGAKPPVIESALESLSRVSHKPVLDAAEAVDQSKLIEDETVTKRTKDEAHEIMRFAANLETRNDS